MRKIARRFGVLVQPIQDLNGISKNTPLRQGRLLLLPLPVQGKKHSFVSSEQYNDLSFETKRLSSWQKYD